MSLTEAFDQAMPTLNIRRLRGAMAENLIGKAEMARVSGLDRTTVSKVLNGHYEPGATVSQKLAQAAEELGLEGVVQPPSEQKQAES